MERDEEAAFLQCIEELEVNVLRRGEDAKMAEQLAAGTKKELERLKEECKALVDDKAQLQRLLRYQQETMAQNLDYARRCSEAEQAKEEAEKKQASVLQMCEDDKRKMAAEVEDLKKELHQKLSETQEIFQQNSATWNERELQLLSEIEALKKENDDLVQAKHAWDVVKVEQEKAHLAMVDKYERKYAEKCAELDVAQQAAKNVEKQHDERVNRVRTNLEKTLMQITAERTEAIEEAEKQRKKAQQAKEECHVRVEAIKLTVRALQQEVQGYRAIEAGQKAKRANAKTNTNTRKRLFPKPQMLQYQATLDPGKNRAS